MTANVWRAAYAASVVLVVSMGLTGWTLYLVLGFLALSLIPTRDKRWMTAWRVTLMSYGFVVMVVADIVRPTLPEGDVTKHMVVTLILAAATVLGMLVMGSLKVGASGKSRG